MSFRLPRLLQHGHAATMPINFKSALCSPFLRGLAYMMSAARRVPKTQLVEGQFQMIFSRMYNIGWVLENQKISPTSEVHAGLTLARSLALEPAPCCAPERLSASCRRSSSSPSASSSSSSPKSYRRSTPSARSLVRSARSGVAL